MSAPPPHPTTPRISGRRRRRAALATGAVAAAALVLWAGALAWGNSPGGRAFLRDRAVRALEKRFGKVEVGDAGLDLLLRARLSPVAVASRDGSPLLRAERVVVRPRLLTLLRGKVEPASVALHRAVFRPGPDGEGIGPLDLYADLDGDGVSGVRVGLPGGGHLDARVRRDGDALAFQAQGSLGLPDDLPHALAARLPLLPSGHVTLRADGRASADGRGASGDVTVRAAGLSLAGERAGPSPLGPFDVAFAGGLSWDGAAARVRLRDGRLTLGDDPAVGAGLEADVSLRGERRFSVSANAAQVPWNALVAALPSDLGPPPAAPAVSGNLSARASVSGAAGRRGDWAVQVDLDLDDLRRAARAAGPTRLASGFEWTAIDVPPGERPRRIAVGPGNPAFLPYPEIPQVLVRAVTASEDGGFFGHRGFDFKEIANAVTDPDRVRGASTITQQLAKNLFLSPERTLARKVREALGTIALEASLPKGRLMEIYLNIAEWGPNGYGAGEAARFWFGKDARELTPREAAFLATVIPSPRHAHARLHRQ
ncbi:MAG TPA: transglycosylase domain-containing protein, partial [Anaeromyxobacteraceae bacterium]|nr:transglycosylase domain-containing protein [Anaeromyxobacteraceae bacterium]